MGNQYLSVSLVANATPQEVFEAINEVKGWWSQDFKGASHQTGDEFEVRFADVHYSRHRITEMIPGKKVVWQTIDSCLNFLDNKQEWTGTTIIFELRAEGGQTHIAFTHEGLTTQSECYRDCSSGWNQFLEQSLLSLIHTGEGQPNVLQEAIDEKSKQQ